MNIRMAVRMGSVVLMLGGLSLTGCTSVSVNNPAVVAPPTVAPTAGVIDLSGVPPNWDKNVPAAQRFAVLAAFNNTAVRDNETGLVWEQAPQPTTVSWDRARFTCINKNVGGRKGWRLPSIPELASLIDASVAAPGPTLPTGHPFLGVQFAYWSATTLAVSPTNAWGVNFVNGDVDSGDKTNSLHAWCVRGGMHADAY